MSVDGTPEATDSRRVEQETLERSLAHAEALCSTGSDGTSVALAFLEAGQVLLERLRRDELAQWVEHTARLAELSPAVAVAFVRASPSIVGASSAERLDWWAQLSHEIARSQWKSHGLAARLLGEATAMLERTEPENVERVAEIVAELSRHSLNAASACLDGASRMLEELPSDVRAPFLALASIVARSAWLDVWFLFEHAPAQLAAITETGRARFLALVSRLAHEPEVKGLPPFAEAAVPLGRLAADVQHAALEIAERIAQRSAPAALAYLTSADEVHARLDPGMAQRWCTEGLTLLDGMQDDAAAVRYFRLESSRAREMLASLTGRVELARVQPMLRLYVTAMSGRERDVEPLEALRERNIGWSSTTRSATDGESLYVPSHMETFSEQLANVQAYKVHAMHQCGRLEFGSYEYVYGADGQHLKSSVRERERDVHPKAIVAIEGFFDLFEDRALITWLFGLVEDTRIDACVSRCYPGLAPWLRRVQAREAEERTARSIRGRRELFLEELLRNALERRTLPRRDFGAELGRAIEILAIARRPEATVQDSAEAAAQIYDLAARIRNVSHPTREEDREVPFETPEPPRYRGRANAELVQLLLDENECDLEDIAELLENSAELEGLDAGAPEIDMMAKRLRKASAERAISEDASADANAEVAIREEGVSWFFYDEWDERAQDYRQSWCRVGERFGAQGDPAFHDAVLDARRGLLNRIRRQFEALRPESVRRVTRLEDGNDIELDRAVTFHVDRSAGVGPLARFFMRRDPVERSVGVGFLVDVSSSTDEPVSRRESGERERRIIDVEKEAVTLIVEALEVIGDSYGIYSFSGAGRGDVRFQVIKDIAEPLEEGAKGRIAGMEPVTATRMGAAIRHAASKLRQTHAKTKLLILISDGRPQDQGYGDGDGGHDYAVQDTRRALVEARNQGIVPFLITISGQGEDYLRPACSDFGYERVADIETLPERLPSIYRHLTAA